MAHGKLRPTAQATKKTPALRDLEVQIDDSDVEMLDQGTLRVLRVTAKQKLDTQPGVYGELEVEGESLPIVDIAVDPKRGMSAIVTVR
jgi:hypothetical protein